MLFYIKSILFLWQANSKWHTVFVARCCFLANFVAFKARKPQYIVCVRAYGFCGSEHFRKQHTLLVAKAYPLCGVSILFLLQRHTVRVAKAYCFRGRQTHEALFYKGFQRVENFITFITFNTTGTKCSPFWR